MKRNRCDGITPAVENVLIVALLAYMKQRCIYRCTPAWQAGDADGTAAFSFSPYHWWQSVLKGIVLLELS